MFVVPRSKGSYSSTGKEVSAALAGKLMVLIHWLTKAKPRQERNQEKRAMFRANLSNLTVNNPRSRSKVSGDTIIVLYHQMQFSSLSKMPQKTWMGRWVAMPMGKMQNGHVNANQNTAQNKTKAVFNFSSQTKILWFENSGEAVILNITNTSLSHCLSLSSVHLPNQCCGALPLALTCY